MFNNKFIILGLSIFFVSVSLLAMNAREKLYRGARFGSIKYIEEALKSSIGINEGLDDYDRTALHLACENGRTEVAKYLLSKNADLEDYNDCYPVERAASLSFGSHEGYPETVSLLLKWGAKNFRNEIVGKCLKFPVNLRDFSPILYVFGKTGKFQELPAIECGMEVPLINQSDITGTNGLMYAAARGNFDFICGLIMANKIHGEIEFGNKSDAGECAYSLAKKFKRTDIVKSLYDHAQEYNAQLVKILPNISEPLIKLMLSYYFGDDIVYNK